MRRHVFMKIFAALSLVAAYGLPSAAIATLPDEAIDPAVNGTYWTSGSPYCPGPFQSPMEFVACFTDYNIALLGRCPVIQSVDTDTDQYGTVDEVTFDGNDPQCSDPGGSGSFHVGVNLQINSRTVDGVSCTDPIAESAEGPECFGESVGNPTYPSQGNKFESVTDYLGTGAYPLQFSRLYSALQTRNPTTTEIFGRKWIVNLDSFLQSWSIGSDQVMLAYRPNGRRVAFKLVGSTWEAPAGYPAVLQQVTLPDSTTGWSLQPNNADIIELYKAPTGTYYPYIRLISRIHRSGISHQFTYSDGAGGKWPSNAPTCTPISGEPVPPVSRLWCVTDSFGRQLVFAYNATTQKIAKMADPAGQITSFTHDTDQRLTHVVYPDGGSGDTREYLYDESSYIPTPGVYGLLTGIVDENSDRYATFKYKSPNIVDYSEHAGGVNKYIFNYVSASDTEVTSPLGTTNTYQYTLVNGIRRLSGISGSACPACGPKALTYDANGFLDSTLDWNDNKICYSHNIRGLEEARVEGLGSGATCSSALSSLPSGARRISTAWHDDWRLVTKLAEPKKLTTYVYNGEPDPTNGNNPLTCESTSAQVNGLPIAVLCKKIEQATTDATGADGLTPTTAGDARIWTYTYNANGQVLTVNGPRTDVTDTTTYAYRTADDTASPAKYKRGDLYTITNALGHVTTLSEYDPHGRVTKIIDPNNIQTVLSYSPRGWLTSQAVTAGLYTQTTSYTYDNVGQVTRITEPDGVYIDFTYDTARRLTQITDALGNKIVYTLDAMGNRTLEETKNAGNTLTRNIERVYDALNRLQEITGGLQ